MKAILVLLAAGALTIWAINTFNNWLHEPYCARREFVVEHDNVQFFRSDSFPCREMDIKILEEFTQ